MSEPEAIDDYLQQLTPLARNCLLTELERLEVCGAEIRGAKSLKEKLHAEFRKGGPAPDRVADPSRYFFAPLGPLLVDGAFEHANAGRIQRGSLSAIWQWISRDLLPTMTRDFVAGITPLITTGDQRGTHRVASVFQAKVVKYLEGTLGSPEGADQTRARLASYTASRSVYGDLTKIMCVLRTREALVKFGDALPVKIGEFGDAEVTRISRLLDEFGAKHAEAVPFALTLIGARLKKPWQLIRLATSATSSKSAVDIAATRYAITVWMVLDRVDDRRSALRAALKNNRILVAKDILIEIYDIDSALRARIERLDESAWGERLNGLMTEIAALVEAEVSRLPDTVGHVLGSRSLRCHQTMAGRLIGRGRDAISDAASRCMKQLGRR